VPRETESSVVELAANDAPSASAADDVLETPPDVVSSLAARGTSPSTTTHARVRSPRRSRARTTVTSSARAHLARAARSRPCRRGHVIRVSNCALYTLEHHLRQTEGLVLAVGMHQP